VFPLVSQIGINYRESRLSETIGNFSVKAGDRMPYFQIDGESIYDNLREPRFHLIAFRDGRTAMPDFGSELGDVWPERMDFHSFPLYPHIADHFGTKQSFVTILRPDNYIGLLTNATATEAIRKYMNDSLMFERAH
jgi:hypothetical protein